MPFSAPPSNKEPACKYLSAWLQYILLLNSGEQIAVQFTIEGIRYDFMPIKDFRAIHQLPTTFNIALFESKDYTGLGRIDAAGAALNQLRTAVIAALPDKALPLSWLSALPEITHIFEAQLYQINDQIGLRDVEIEFAVAGFNDAKTEICM